MAQTVQFTRVSTRQQLRDVMMSMATSSYGWWMNEMSRQYYARHGFRQVSPMQAMLVSESEKYKSRSDGLTGGQTFKRRGEKNIFDCSLNWEPLSHTSSLRHTSILSSVKTSQVLSPIRGRRVLLSSTIHSSMPTVLPSHYLPDSATSLPYPSTSPSKL